MPSGLKKRKISDLADALLIALNGFREVIDEDDEDLPSGLIAALDSFRAKLETVKHVSFSKVDPMTLLQVNIKSGPLFLVPENRLAIEQLGSFEVAGKVLSMDVLKELITLVRDHVSLITEAGCRILINLALLRVASIMSDEQTDVNIIPEYPISKALFPGNHSFGGVVNFLMAKLPRRYTRYLLEDPTTALGNPDTIKGPVTSNIFEAKRDNVRAAIPQAVMAASSHCKQHNIQVLRGCITSGEQWIFFVYQVINNRGLVSSSEEFAIGPHFENLPLIIGLLRDWVDNTTESQQRYFTRD